MAYEQEVARYNALVDDTLAHPEKLDANLVEIRAVNQRLARILDEMLADAHNTRGTSATVRDELIEKLHRIQRDYNGLLQNTDKLETLRRIRKGETENWWGSLSIYILAFLVVALVAIVLVMFTRQKVATIPTAPMMATASPSFV
jgi:hypothetical protein